MDYIAVYEDVEQLASIEPEELNRKRLRLRLCDKKRIVDQYQDYVKDKLIGKNELSMKAFIEYYNDENHSTKICFSSLSKWVKSEKRGEYLSWDRINNLEAYISNSNKILLAIDFTLARRDVFHAAYNRVAKSPSLPDQYGVVARKFTPAGTFLGFYKGEVMVWKQANDHLNICLSLERTSSSTPQIISLVLLDITIVPSKLRIRTYLLKELSPPIHKKLFVSLQIEMLLEEKSF